MKKTLIFAALFLFCMSCEMGDFNVENPDVEKFVQQITNGTYDKYEFGENGEKLWTNMPHFKEENIPLLLGYSMDTTLICPCHHFPINPISSIPPHRVDNGKDCMLIGEYLLWCVEGIIEGSAFPSLTPILENQNKGHERLNGKEILEVRTLYQDWWEEYSKSGNTSKLPLEGTIYQWR